MNEAVAKWVETPRFNSAIQTIIVINAIVLGMQTSDFIYSRIGTVLDAIDDLCLLVFVIEIVLKLFFMRFAYFRSGWNIFDFSVVAVSLAPALGVNLSVLRALRVLRLLRVVSFAPQLRIVVEGMLRSLPGIGSVFLLLGLIYYVGAVVSTQLYSDTFPQFFGTLGTSAFSLFQIMTLEGWPDVARSVMEVHPNAWFFFVVYIMATNFLVLNLVVGLIVNSMESAHGEGQQEKTDAYQDEALAALREIRERLTDLESRRD